MSSDPSQWGEAHALFAVSCLELLCLFYGYRLRKVTWEQLWILIVECFSYGCAATVPEAQFRTLQLSNGREIPWLRFMGWLLTCPVLLMGLVSIGTMTGTSTSVRLVPVLVANFRALLLVWGSSRSSVHGQSIHRYRCSSGHMCIFAHWRAAEPALGRGPDVKAPLGVVHLV